MVKKSKETTTEKTFFPAFLLCARNPAFSDSKERYLSVYKSIEDAEFVRDFVFSEGIENVPDFELGEKEELFIKEIPSQHSFGKTLPSEEKELNRLEGELDKLLESLQPSE